MKLHLTASDSYIECGNDDNPWAIMPPGWHLKDFRFATDDTLRVYIRPSRYVGVENVAGDHVVLVQGDSITEVETLLMQRMVLGGLSLHRAHLHMVSLHVWKMNYAEALSMAKFWVETGRILWREEATPDEEASVWRR